MAKPANKTVTGIFVVVALEQKRPLRAWAEITAKNRKALLILAIV